MIYTLDDLLEWFLEDIPGFMEALGQGLEELLKSEGFRDALDNLKAISESLAND